MVKGDPSHARQLLLDDLENLRSIKGWRIEVVFDGAGRNSRSGPLGDTRQRLSAADKAASTDITKHGVRTVFTGSGIEADSYIEARCAKAKNVTQGATTGSFIVATDDAMIRLAGLSAGALCMSADRFVSELKAMKKAVAYRVEAAMAMVNGGTMIRPEKLWGTHTFARTNNAVTNNSPSKDKGTDSNSTKMTSLHDQPVQANKLMQTEDGRTIYTGRFGRGALIIEDKRKKKPPKNGSKDSPKDGKKDPNLK
jgi:predicted RNA-binding protein with PIN domain